MNQFNIAQINIARARAPINSKIMQGFVNRLDEINALADKSDGFIWRLQEETGNATSIQAYDDPSIIVNMSVWKTIQHLKNFVYQSAHVELIRNRNAWFSKIASSHSALWWIPVGHFPTIEEGKKKLELLDRNGASIEVFTFGKIFDHSV